MTTRENVNCCILNPTSCPPSGVVVFLPRLSGLLYPTLLWLSILLHFSSLSPFSSPLPEIAFRRVDFSLLSFNAWFEIIQISDKAIDFYLDTY